MPPKMFKIKKAEVAKDDDNANTLVVSDYQQERLETQVKQAEDQRVEEVKRAVATDADGPRPGGSVKQEDDDKAKRGGLGKNTSGGSNAPMSSARSGPALTVLSYGVADALPSNTMDAVLSAVAPSDVNYYQPMMLNPHGVELSREQEALALGYQSAQPSAVVKSGTAFLEEGHRELLASYAANKEFFDGQQQQQQESARGDDDNAGVERDDAYMLMQFPRPVRELASSCSLDQMAPGRIGKLTVYKSGRATMTIGGVAVDVALEPQTRPEGSPLTGPVASAEGISRFAVAVDGSDLARRGCYQLCWIPRKVVCTPRLEDDQQQ